jgi:hypothetical protein
LPAVFLKWSTIVYSQTVYCREDSFSSKRRPLNSTLPLQLYYFAPYSVALLFPPVVFLEWSLLIDWRAELPGLEAAVPCGAILFSGLIAFGLNLSVIYAVKATR